MTVDGLIAALQGYPSDLPVHVRSADGGPVAGAVTVVAVVEDDGVVYIVVGGSLPGGYGRAQW